MPFIWFLQTRQASKVRRALLTLSLFIATVDDINQSTTRSIPNVIASFPVVERAEKGEDEGEARGFQFAENFSHLSPYFSLPTAAFHDGSKEIRPPSRGYKSRFSTIPA